MTEDWIETTLGEVSDISIGRTPPRKEPGYWSEDLSRPFCTIADMRGPLIDPAREGVTERAVAEGKAKLVPGGSLLMSFKLTIGRVGFAARDLYPNEAIAWIRSTHSELDERFLALWLGSQDLSRGSGRAVKGETLNGASLREIKVRFPPLLVQRRIVDLIAHLDNHRATMRESKARLSQARLGIVQSALRDISEGARGQEQWPTLTLGELTARTRPICYGVLKPGPDTPNGVPLIRIQDMENDVLATDGYHLISPPLDEEFRRSRLIGGEVLLSIQGTVGRVAICPEELAGANISRTVAVIQPDRRLIPEFLRLHLQEVARTNGFDDSGSTRASLNISTIREMKVVVPSLELQRELVTEVSAVDDLISTLEAEWDSLSQLRSAVLADLLSGALGIDESYDALLPEVS